MSAVTITNLTALEILDSRSRPTVKATLTLTDGTQAIAQVPSGASTGTREAVELRDGDKNRYQGEGVLTAVGNVTGEIADAVVGKSFDSSEALDSLLIDLDATPNKSRLGANAILGVSMAFARALAQSQDKPLFESLPGVSGQEKRLPVPCFNVLNGGVHAKNPLDFQEFMICPAGAPNIAEAVRAGSEIYSVLRNRLNAEGHPVGLGDEGGFAPDFAEPEAVLDELVAAIKDAGYRTGKDGICIAMDPASSEFHQADGTYLVNGKNYTSDQMIDRYEAMLDQYPIWLLEDGLAENDWDGWQRLTQRLGERVELVGDDIFCTNPAIISEGIAKHVANASLIKLNQIGTVTETIQAQRICAAAGYGQFMSHRSGETPDDFIADLVVATGCGKIKSGAPARGERVAKYNRMMEISAQNPGLPFGAIN